MHACTPLPSFTFPLSPFPFLLPRCLISVIVCLSAAISRASFSSHIHYISVARMYTFPSHLSSFLCPCPPLFPSCIHHPFPTSACVCVCLRQHIERILVTQRELYICCIHVYLSHSSPLPVSLSSSPTPLVLHPPPLFKTQGACVCGNIDRVFLGL